MKTFSIYTRGCKVNQYESQQIRQLLQQHGLKQALPEDISDLVIVNTCCVTHTASAKSRQYINQAQRANPDAVIVVSGCLPMVETGEKPGPGKNIHLVADREKLVEKINEILISNTASHNKNSDDLSKEIKPKNARKIKPKKDFGDFDTLPNLSSFEGQTRAFLKVQDGCDGHCTYCIIPKARPKLSSKSVSDITAEAKRLVDSGHKEIVVAGIFLGAYGLETVRRRRWSGSNGKLPEMLRALSKVEGLNRIRLSSLEPGDVTDELLDVFCENRNLLPHLHLSLQSGSDTVLRRMARQYRSADFLEKVAMIESRLGAAAITTDMIVGFPGETEEEFQESYNFAKRVGFAKIHVFSFSARRGTAAAKLETQMPVPAVVKKDRSKILSQLDLELQSKFREKFIGKKVSVLIEKAGEKYAQGRCGQYFVVRVNGSDITQNTIIEAEITKNGKNFAIAKR